MSHRWSCRWRTLRFWFALSNTAWRLGCVLRWHGKIPNTGFPTFPNIQLRRPGAFGDCAWLGRELGSDCASRQKGPREAGKPRLGARPARDVLGWDRSKACHWFRRLGGLAFVFLLLANLRFIGVMGLMILGARGWRWRTMVGVVLEIITAADTGMFHEFVLWSLGLFAVYVFTRRPRLPIFLGLLAAIAVGVFLLNDAKWELRAAIWTGSDEVTVFGKQIRVTSWNRTFVGGLCLIQSATKTFTGGYSKESLGDMVMRFNQGWIIDRVMRYVPRESRTPMVQQCFPLEAALLPRVLAPDKQIAGGRL